MNDIPDKIIDFLESKIEFEDIYDLPQFYPKISELTEFQYGYRFNPISKESLIGNKEGDWKEEWYVICSNYFNDPFIVNILEGSDDFPIYSARHGEGEWNLKKICNSITEFRSVLNKIKTLEKKPIQAIEYIKSINFENQLFWAQIIEELEYVEEEE